MLIIVHDLTTQPWEVLISKSRRFGFRLFSRDTHLLQLSFDLSNFFGIK
jgi:hypothetical protein